MFQQRLQANNKTKEYLFRGKWRTATKIAYDAGLDVRLVRERLQVCATEAEVVEPKQAKSQHVLGVKVPPGHYLTADQELKNLLTLEQHIALADAWKLLCRRTNEAREAGNDPLLHAEALQAFRDYQDDLREQVTGIRQRA